MQYITTDGVPVVHATRAEMEMPSYWQFFVNTGCIGFGYDGNLRCYQWWKIHKGDDFLTQRSGDFISGTLGITAYIFYLHNNIQYKTS